MDRSWKVLILSGGKSQRMGRDKALLPVGDRTLLEGLVEEFSLGYPCILSVDKPGRYGGLPCPAVSDHYPETGPMGAIASAFEAGVGQGLFVTACDMPLVTCRFVQALTGRWDGSSHWVLCRDREGRLYPLGALYRSQMLPALQNCLQRGDYRLRSLLEPVPHQILSLEELGLGEQVLLNLNRPEEYLEFIRKNR